MPDLTQDNPYYLRDLVAQAIPDKPIEPSLTLDETNILRKIDGLEALKQTINHILTTERYALSIYDHRYGVELDQYIGQPMDFVTADINRVIKEALMEDDRIEDVHSFVHDQSGAILTVSFVVESNLGKVEAEVQVDD